MDRRSWLWRRKSSEKTPGESESSGSISSPSERFLDEQAYSGHSKHSSDVTSRAAPNEESPGKVKALTEKLSAALSNISAKEEIVKQHAKVTEEAVTGWEKAEREVSRLKLQLDAAVKKNLALEDRVGHLDGALKECVRQLRHAREEQERKSGLESQVSELSSKLEAARSEAEKESKSLMRKLETMTLERDLSTKSAESASKQHLESIKKAAKLEAECRRLRSCVRKASARVDCVSDSRSDCTKLEPSQSSLGACSSEIAIMEDFLEMERVAALPENGNRTRLEASIRQLKDTEERSVELENRLNECRAQLEASEGRLRDAGAELRELQDQLSECKGKLTTSEQQAKDANDIIVDLQAQLASASKLKQDAEAALEASDAKRVEAELRVKALESETSSLEAKVKSLVDEAVEERALFTEAMAKCRSLEKELSKRDLEPKKAVQEKGLALAAGKLADCQKTIESLGKQLESLAKLDDFLVDSSYSPLELSKEPSLFRTTELRNLPCIGCQ